MWKFLIHVGQICNLCCFFISTKKESYVIRKKTPVEWRYRCIAYCLKAFLTPCTALCSWEVQLLILFAKIRLTHRVTYLVVKCLQMWLHDVQWGWMGGVSGTAELSLVPRKESSESPFGCYSWALIQFIVPYCLLWRKSTLLQAKQAQWQ